MSEYKNISKGEAQELYTNLQVLVDRIQGELDSMDAEFFESFHCEYPYLEKPLRYVYECLLIFDDKLPVNLYKNHNNIHGQFFDEWV